MSDSKKSSILRKVQALLAKADATPFSDEADTFRQKADELMTLYAIEEFELEQAGGAKREEVTKRVFRVSEEGSPIRESLVDLASVLAKHCRVRIVYFGLQGSSRQAVTATLVGFPSDLDYFEMMNVSLHMAMAKDLEPKYDPSLTLGQNVKRMKESGMKWERIAALCDPNWDGKLTAKWVGIYKRQCKEDGTEPIKTMPSVYVKNFAAGFVTEISIRLKQMREQTETNLKSTGHDLVLFKTRDEEVDEKFREFFPRLKYAPVRASGKFDGNARMAGAKSGRRADLSGGRNSAGTGVRGVLN